MRDPFFHMPETQRKRLQADESVRGAIARIDRLRFFTGAIALALIGGVLLFWRLG